VSELSVERLLFFFVFVKGHRQSPSAPIASSAARAAARSCCDWVTMGAQSQDYT
jgi:hypothetical protein